MNPSRRWVLQSIGASSASWVLTFAGCGGSKYSVEVAGLQGLVEGDLAWSVGERYIARHPEEGDTDKLVEALVGGQIDEQKLRELPDLIVEAVRRDFETGQVVNLRRWRLSRTEGRLCALLSLNRGWW